MDGVIGGFDCVALSWLGWGKVFGSALFDFFEFFDFFVFFDFFDYFARGVEYSLGDF